MTPRRLLAASIVLLAPACASEGFPPGGPVDVEPPVLVESDPADRAVNAEPEQAIRLVFDEVLDDRQLRNLPDLILVNPRVPEFDYTLDDEVVILDPQTPMLDATTYIVTLLPGLSDREGNATTTRRSILFSVGGKETIPLSVVRATIVRDTVPVPGARYRLEDPESELAYETVADSQGMVALEGVAYASYEATAWEERVRPHGWQVTEEAGARDTFVLGPGNRAHQATYRIAVRDTTPPLVVAVTATAGRLLAVRFDDRLPEGAVPGAGRVRLWEGPQAVDVPPDSVPLEAVRGRRIRVESVERTGPSELQVVPVEPVRRDRVYRLEVPGLENVDGLPATAEGGLAFRPRYEGPAVWPSEPVSWPEGVP